MPESLEDSLRKGMETLLTYAQASERIRALMALNKHLVEEFAELLKVDPELQPELQAAAKHLDEAQAALLRAHQFAGARMDAQLEAE